MTKPKDDLWCLNRFDQLLEVGFADDADGITGSRQFFGLAML